MIIVGGDDAPHINPFDTKHHDKPLWCVYGPKSFPTLICCKVNTKTGKDVIWGYSIYRGRAGFRTLGRELHDWMNEHDAMFFDDHSKALDHIGKITEPKIKT